MTELQADGQAFRWDGVCGQCVKRITDQNRIYDAERRSQEHRRQQEQARRQQEHHLLALRAMQDVDASNRSNSRSYHEAVRAHQHEIDAAVREWGMGEGIFGGSIFADGPLPAQGRRRRVFRR